VPRPSDEYFRFGTGVTSGLAPCLLCGAVGQPPVIRSAVPVVNDGNREPKIRMRCGGTECLARKCA
jgi:hypothetical protein